MATDAVIKKLEYLQRCLREGPLAGSDDADTQKLLEFLSSDMLQTPDEERALSSHMIRFMETFLRLRGQPQFSRLAQIVEVGHLSLLARFLANDGYKVRPCMGDFRYSLNMQTGNADILLALEVFEHVKDQDSIDISDIDIFNFSGINRFLQECRRLLRPDGCLVITTPNACSLRSLVNLVNHQNPATFYPHVKEYAPQDVVHLCARSGLKLVHFATFYAYYYLSHDRQKVLESYIMKPGFSPEHRGDCSFFIFCRDDASIPEPASPRA